MSISAILLCIAVVLFLIGQIRLGCSVEYSGGGPSVWIHVGALRILVFPIKQKEDKPKKTKPPKKKKDPVKKEEEVPTLTEKIGGTLDYAEQLVPIVLRAVGHFYRKLSVDHLRLELFFGAKDPADVALRYGQASAALGALWYPMVEVLNVRDGSAHLTPDFECEDTTIYVYGKLTLKIGQLLWFGLYFGFQGLHAFLTVRKQHKTQQKQGKAV